jgi:hypothetical protein
MQIQKRSGFRVWLLIFCLLTSFGGFGCLPMPGCRPCRAWKAVRWIGPPSSPVTTHFLDPLLNPFLFFWFLRIFFFFSNFVSSIYSPILPLFSSPAGYQVQDCISEQLLVGFVEHLQTIHAWEGVWRPVFRPLATWIARYRWFFFRK